MIKKKQRSELYDKFRQGAIPSGADFAELIRSQLNLLDDGLDITDDPNDPVCLKAHGDKENLLDFADADGIRRWRISNLSEDKLNEGLNLKADEKNRLYIERETGNVGINTDKPGAKLHLIQNDAATALRIDDAGNDTTPFIIASEGQVGIGTDSPQAQLHISYAGTGDVMRVDDTTEDTTPFIIDERGYVGIGCESPQARLTIMDGGISIGKNANPGNNSLYVKGDLEIEGNIIVAGGTGKGGIEIEGPIRATTKDFYIEDNVYIVADPDQAGSHGDLSVEGDTTLGTYNNVTPNVILINGNIRSGYDSRNQQNQQLTLDINEALVVSREPGKLAVTVNGKLTVTGTSALGDNLAGDLIKLNGTVQRDGSDPLTFASDLQVNENFTVSKNSNLFAASVSNNLTVGNDLTVTGKLSVSGDSSLAKVNVANNFSVTGTSTLAATTIGSTLNVTGTSTLAVTTIGSTLTVTGSSTLAGVTVGQNLTVNGNSTLKATTVDSIKIGTGTVPTINSFSTDSNLGTSDSTVSTQKAVKTYVDNHVAAIRVVYA